MVLCRMKIHLQNLQSESFSASKSTTRRGLQSGCCDVGSFIRSGWHLLIKRRAENDTKPFLYFWLADWSLDKHSGSSQLTTCCPPPTEHIALLATACTGGKEMWLAHFERGRQNVYLINFPDILVFFSLFSFIDWLIDWFWGWGGGWGLLFLNFVYGLFPTYEIYPLDTWTMLSYVSG